MSANHFVRQHEILDATLLAATPIDLVGLGGIGSATALILAKMGARLRLADDDEVGPENVASQLYGPADAAARRPKAEALRDHLARLTGTEPRAVVGRGEALDLRGIVVTALDSMRSRRAVWEAVCASPEAEWLLDARMGATQGTLVIANLLDPRDREAYEATLFDDGIGLPAACTGEMAIAYNTTILAGLVARQVARIVSGVQTVERRIDIDLGDFLSLYVS